MRYHLPRVLFLSLPIVVLTLIGLWGPSAQAAPPPDFTILEPVVTGLAFATDLEIDATGNLYVLNQPLRQMNVYDHDGTMIDSVPIPVDTPARIWQALGLALDPDFPSAPYLYIHYVDGFRWSNVVIRFRLENGVTSDVSTLLDVPLPIHQSDPENHCSEHNGGHLVFAPDKTLLIGLGDNFCYPEFADDVTKPQGSILRIDRRTGAGLTDNPFYDGDGPNDDRIWAIGQRNPFGLAYDPITGWLWSSDNGPGCGDEINVIERGLNYGWPHSHLSYFECVDPGAGYQPPAWEWQTTIGPTGLTAYTGVIAAWRDSLFMCDWNNGYLHRLRLDAGRNTVVSDEVIELDPNICRLDVESGPDGALYIVNTDAVYRLTSLPIWLPLVQAP